MKVIYCCLTSNSKNINTEDRVKNVGYSIVYVARFQAETSCMQFTNHWHFIIFYLWNSLKCEILIYHAQKKSYKIFSFVSSNPSTIQQQMAWRNTSYSSDEPLIPYGWFMCLSNCFSKNTHLFQWHIRTSQVQLQISGGERIHHLHFGCYILDVVFIFISPWGNNSPRCTVSA